MAIVKKRADALMIGDIVIWPDRTAFPQLPVSSPRPETRESLVYLGTQRSTDLEIDLRLISTRSVWNGSRPHDRRVASSTILDVEAPDDVLAPGDLEMLTDAAHLLLTNGSTVMDDARAKLQAILDRLDPPEPPTLAEVLAVVDELTQPPRAYPDGEENAFVRGRKILDRARRAGLL